MAATSQSGSPRLNPKPGSRIYYHLASLRGAYERAIDTHVRPLGQVRVLDYGCGDMPYRPLFEDIGATYQSHDLGTNALADCSLNSDGTLACGGSCADVVLSSQVLEHVHDPLLYLGECHRVLRPGGLLLLSTHGVWKFHPDPTDFWRWTSAGLQKIIGDSGFGIVDFRGVVGPAATGIQLWQDATLPRVPGRLQAMFCRFAQWRMKKADGKCSEQQIDDDASVYVCVARKR